MRGSCRARRARLVMACAGLLAAWRPAAAQGGAVGRAEAPPPGPSPVRDAAEGAPPRALATCDGQPISDIVVITQPPFTERLPRQLEFVRRAVRDVHASTRDRVIRGYLLLRVGDPCDELRRTESERILRAQPYLVDARIVAVDDGQGGVRLDVETRDEFSLVASVDIRDVDPKFRAARLGENNLAGAGLSTVLDWRAGGAYENVVGIRVVDYQFAGRRNEFRLAGRRGSIDEHYAAELVRPYYTDLQRVAWRAAIGGTRDYVRLLRPGLEPNAVPVQRDHAEVGGVARIGSVGRLKLVGLSLTREAEETEPDPVLITPLGFVPDTLGPAPGGFRTQRVARVNALLGVRRVRFVRVQGFDALTGVQDVRVGMQLGVVLGRSIGGARSDDRDRFVAGDVYAGWGGRKSFLAIQGVGEARQDAATRAWDGIVTNGRAVWYFKPAVPQTTLTQLEWSSGIDVQSAFQLSMADRDGGLHGHCESRIPGGHRAVLRVEHRTIVPTRYNVADGGVAVFGEMGRLWRGAVPYGETTPIRGALGLSLQAAVPPRSRRLWRVDFAWPLGSDPDARFEVRFSNRDRARAMWDQPGDLRRARERAVPASIFSWP